MTFEQIHSIEDAIKLTNKHCYSKTWLFRGHGYCGYKLTPGIGRLIDSEGFKGDVSKLLRLERQSFDHFKIKTHYQLTETNQLILLAAAQHHGLKTRLLDWSLSILTALYFAVEDLNEKVDGALIAYQAPDKFNLYQEEDPFNQEIEYSFLLVPDLSPRIKAQQGIFQLFKHPTIPMDISIQYNLLKFMIPFERKRHIKRELYRLGIHAESLFPDLDGLCKTINYHSLGVCSKPEDQKQKTPCS